MFNDKTLLNTKSFIYRSKSKRKKINIIKNQFDNKLEEKNLNYKN